MKSEVFPSTTPPKFPLNVDPVRAHRTRYIPKKDPESVLVRRRYHNEIRATLALQTDPWTYSSPITSWGRLRKRNRRSRRQSSAKYKHPLLSILQRRSEKGIVQQSTLAIISRCSLGLVPSSKWHQSIDYVVKVIVTRSPFSNSLASQWYYR